MSVRKDPRSPYWQYDFQRNKERFHGSTGCTTRRDAERFESDLKRRIALGENTKPQITLDLACQAYWEEKGQHESASSTTEYQLANLCSIIGPQRLLRDLRLKDFQDYITKRRKQKARNSDKPISAASINREWQLARRVWKLAISKGYDVPTPGTEHGIDWSKLKLDEPKERVRELTAEEEKRLFASLDPDVLAVAEFAMLSGQRKSAIITLRWDHVDFVEQRAKVKTKGDKWHAFPLTSRMIELIQQRPRVEKVPQVFTYECKRPSPARPGRAKRYRGQRYAFSKNGWARRWYQALKDAGVEDFRFHDLRHTSATRIVRSTGNLKIAQRLLGHTDIATTSRYAHVNEDDVRAAMKKTESRNSHGKHLRATRTNARKSAESDTVG
jgi:integrase